MLLHMDQSSQESIAKSAARIAFHNFEWNYATLVVFNSTLICSVDFFIRSYQKNVIIGHGTFYPSFVKIIRQFVIFGVDLSDIVQMLAWMKRHQFDNTGKYIVVCEPERWEECNEVDIVNILWNYKIINVVLINYRKENTVIGFTYYEPEDCKNIRPTSVKNWEPCLLNGHKHCLNMYPVKLKNLHRCPITVSTFDQIPYMYIINGTPTGADGDLLRVIAKAMNFSLVIMTPRVGFGWGKVEDNGTWSGSLADVYNDWANFSMTSSCITQTRFTSFQMSMDYAIVTVVWVTHPAQVQPSFFKLLRPFEPNVRIALGISFLMVLLFKIFLKSKFMSSLGHEVNVKFPANIVFLSWKLYMGLPVKSLTKNKALLYVVMFWIWYSLLIRTFYQVCLINSLQTDVRVPEFGTIEEFIESNYTFGGGLALRDYYLDNDLVYEGWENVESVEIPPIMMKLSQGLKFVLAMNVETTNMFLNSNPNKKLHILPQGVVTSPTVIFFKKYSPLANSLNVVLTRLRESGVIHKIYTNNIGENILKEIADEDIPITMAHYTGCYAILLIGWLLSGLCFIVEKLTMTHKKSKLVNIYP